MSSFITETYYQTPVYRYLLVGLDNGDVAHKINPVICFLTKTKWPKI